MTLAQSGRDRLIRRLERPRLIALLLFATALLVRSHRITTIPLWLDELYGYQLGTLGFRAIIRNSVYDPHPPLFYLIEWASSGFGSVHSAIAWRWLSVLSGALTVPLTFLFARIVTTTFGALISGLLLLLAPAHIYASQEARSAAFMLFLAVCSALVLVEIERRPAAGKSWAAWTLLSLVGLWCSYSYVLVVSVQVLSLALATRLWRRMLLLTLVLGVSCLPLAAFFLSAGRAALAVHTESTPLTLFRVVSALLAGEPVRYGAFWAHSWLPYIAGGLGLLGLWQIVRLRGRDSSLYVALQVLLPPAIFFGIAVPVFGLTLPLFESKQFAVALPMFFVLVGYGAGQLERLLPRWAGRLLAMVLVSLMVCGNIVGLQRYWTIPKSPEGSAVLAVRQQMQPGDVVVSLHYSIDAALSFYLPDASVYTKPGRVGDDFFFSQSTLVVKEQEQSVSRPTPLAAIRRYPRIWVLGRELQGEGVKSALLADCAQSTQLFRPFQVVLASSCR